MIDLPDLIGNRKGKPMKFLFLSLFTAVCWGAESYADITLVEAGKARGEILISSRPSKAAQYGAQELQYHIRLISGANLPIRKNSDLKGGIVLSAERSATFPKGPEKHEFKGEEYAVETIGNSIFFQGTEYPDYGEVNFLKHGTWPLKPDNSLLFAVYDFIETALDVRWYAPGEIGTTFTPRKNIVLTKLSFSRIPLMDGFRISSDPPIRKTEKETFTIAASRQFYLRQRMTKRFGFSNHNISSIYYRYWKKAKDPEYAALFLESRPEFFARNLPREWHLMHRRLTEQYPGELLPPQICDSNPEVIEYFAKEAVEFRRTGKLRFGARRPGTMVKDAPFFYPIEFEDNQAFCNCRNCQNLFQGKTGGELRSYRRTRFLNKVAEKAAELDAMTGISGLSYSPFHCPVGMTLEKNLAINLCFTPEKWYAPPIRKNNWTQYQEWVKLARRHKNPLFLYTYLNNGGWDAVKTFKYNDYFPQFHAERVGQFMKMLRQDGIRGIYITRVFNYCVTQLEEYIYLRMAYDASAKPEQIISEFFTRYYGNSAVPMRKFYELVEKTTNDWKNYPPSYTEGKMQEISYAGNLTQDICWGRLGTREKMVQLEHYLKEADKIADTPLVKARLQLFRESVWEMMKRGRAAYEKRLVYLQTPASVFIAPVVAGADGNPEKIEWNKLPASAMKTINGAPAPAGMLFQTAYDEDFLYFHFQERRPSKGYRFNPNRKWKGDTLELFLSPTGTRPYYQVAVFPDGSFLSSVYRNTNMIDVTSPVNLVTKLFSSTADGWDVVFSIPLARIGKEDVLQQGFIFCNLFRNQFKREALAWNPVFRKNFHDLSRMGKIRIKSEGKK